MPVKAALCFIAAEWKLFAKPFQQNGVWITWAKVLAGMISEPGPLTQPMSSTFPSGWPTGCRQRKRVTEEQSGVKLPLSERPLLAMGVTVSACSGGVYRP